MRHTYTCQVRWSDVDAYGHVNNVTYFEYYQEARIAFLYDLGAWAVEAGSEQLVVARLTVDYRRPILFRAEPFAIDSWVTRIGTSSFDVRSQIRDGHEVLSSAVAVLVGFDSRTARSRPVNADERAVLTSVLEPER
ncbi:thioesterase family protein [soil metagenome]